MIHSDEALAVQLTEYADTLADIPDFLERVKERLDLLKGEAKTAEESLGDTEGELASFGDDHKAVVMDYQRAVSAISSDLEVMIELAMEAGVNATTICASVKTDTARNKARAVAGRGAF